MSTNPQPSRHRYKLWLSSHKYLFNSLFFGASAIGFGGGGLLYCLKFENEPGLAFCYTYILLLLLTVGPLGGGEILINFGKELRTFQFFSLRLLWPLALRLMLGPLIVSLAIVPTGIGFIAWALQAPMTSTWLFALNLSLLGCLAFALGAFITAFPRSPRFKRVIKKFQPIGGIAFVVALVTIIITKRGWTGPGKMIIAVAADLQALFDYIYTLPVIGPATLYFFSSVYLLTKLHVGNNLPLGPQLAFACVTLLLTAVLTMYTLRFTSVNLAATALNWYYTTRSQQIEFYAALDEAVNRARLEEEAASSEAPPWEDLPETAVPGDFLEEQSTDNEDEDQEANVTQPPASPPPGKPVYHLPQNYTPELLLGMLHRIETRREVILKWGGIFLLTMLISLFVGPFIFPLIWLVSSAGALNVVNYLAPENLSSQTTPQRVWPLVWWKLRTSIFPRIIVDVLLGILTTWYLHAPWIAAVPFVLFMTALRTQYLVCEIHFRAGAPTLLGMQLGLLVFLVVAAFRFTILIGKNGPEAFQLIPLVSLGCLVLNAVAWITFALSTKICYDNLLHIAKLPKNT